MSCAGRDAMMLDRAKHEQRPCRTANVVLGWHTGFVAISAFVLMVGMVAAAVGRIRGIPGLALEGVHAHIGSQLFDLEPFRREVAQLAGLRGNPQRVLLPRSPERSLTMSLRSTDSTPAASPPSFTSRRAPIR